MAKFSSEDELYLTARKEVAKKLGLSDLWSHIDQWPLYVGLGCLGRFMAIADLVQQVQKVPGHVAEFGCWQGSNLMFLAKLLKITEPWGSKQVFGFDTFEGLQTFRTEDGPYDTERGKYKGDLARLKMLLELYDIRDSVELVIGDIKHTLPEILDSRPALTFSFVYCDVDLHEPTEVILKNIHSRLSKGGLIVLDEWNYDSYPGETIAVRQFLEQHSNSYRSCHIKNARQPSLYLEKLE